MTEKSSSLKVGSLIEVTPVSTKYLKAEGKSYLYIILAEVDETCLGDDHYYVSVFSVENNTETKLFGRFFVLHPDAWKVIE
jgi:hypothetical protein